MIIVQSERSMWKTYTQRQQHWAQRIVLSSFVPTHSHVHICVSNNAKENKAVKSLGKIKGIGGLKRGEENDVVQ